MHFGFILDSSNTGLWNTRFVRYTFRFVRYKWLQKTFCLSPRRFADIFNTCLQDRSSRRLQDMSSRRLQEMSSRRLQYVFSVTYFRLPRCFQDVFKTSCEMSSRRLGRRIIISLKTYWRRLQDMSWRPTIVCWVSFQGHTHWNKPTADSCKFEAAG